MARGIADLLQDMRSNPAGVAFTDALRAAEHSCGEARVKGSHPVFRTPWPGNPRVNLQKNGKAKACQVRQLLAAIEMPGNLPSGGEDA